MKIAIISPNTANLRTMAEVLTAASHQVSCTEGGKSRMRAVAEAESPDLVLVEGMCCDPSELSAVEQLGEQYPRIAVVLLCPTHTPDFLMQAMRAGVREVLPSPASAEALRAMAGRIEAKLPGAGRRSGRILAFMPCKGGSGATFLATNLAALLAERSSVLLVDLNIQFGDALAFVHDGRPASTLADVAAATSRLDGALLAASCVNVAPNFALLAAPLDLTQSMEVKPEHIDQLLAVAAARYDFVLLDLPRLLDTLAIHALDRCTRIYPVLQASLPAVHNARRLLAAFDALGYRSDKTELIVNRWERSNTLSLEEIGRALGAATLRTVPNAWREVNGAIDQGAPVARSARGSGVARTLAEFAESLQPRPEAGRGLLTRWFGRA
ncbi:MULTISPECIES: AAA family ATPase [Ramlibacter]|uniref:AAA family ATPase n=1 Tax=Ramlibacter aquaticus TaxID=2780094 RepID=A0ABR9SJ30_9BURK|nr:MULTISPECIES: AAA family ATPase [Ramlibacter]MBE7942376.1 AAA family ATPase [Ramlibacter aquaticus]